MATRGRKRINPIVTTTNIDDLCDMVNEKYNLIPNSIGSIEYHSDMSESSIVQIMNAHRGVRQLVSGGEKELKQYLRSILEDKTILNFWAV
ncbi:MAG: hypothetical protein IKB64_10635 [Paludibacteraceae bacterium]|nr:hypothetical protein [Paludibacteraceae bacterium]